MIPWDIGIKLGIALGSALWLVILWHRLRECCGDYVKNKKEV